LAGISIDARLNLWCARVALLIRRRDVPRDAGEARTAAPKATPTAR
jgi:hypothetical protein